MALDDPADPVRARLGARRLGLPARDGGRFDEARALAAESNAIFEDAGLRAERGCAT